MRVQRCPISADEKVLPQLLGSIFRQPVQPPFPWPFLPSFPLCSQQQFRARGRGWGRGTFSGNSNNNNSSASGDFQKRTREEEWDPEYTPKSKKYYLVSGCEKGWKQGGVGCKGWDAGQFPSPQQLKTLEWFWDSVAFGFHCPITQGIIFSHLCLLPR